jgi:chromate transporter
MPPATHATPEHLSPLQLLLVFLRIGSLSWGGGASTLAMMHTEFCVRRSLLSDAEFQVLFGLSRMVPGMNLISLTVLLGHSQQGLAGALIALAALSIPSFTLIVLGCLWLRDPSLNPYLAGAVRALGPAAAALLLHTGIQVSGGSLRKQGTIGRLLWLVVAAVTTLAALGSALHPGWLIIGGGILGVLVARWAGEKRA